MNSEEKILKDLKAYCKRYDVPLVNIVDVISDLKVIPMIRGKAFEFVVSNILKGTLNSDSWDVKNLNINAQPGIHDVDVLVLRKSDNKNVRIECKLTKNNSFSIRDDQAIFRVKCMRSRTFSDNPAATRMASSYGVPRDLLLIHADSYRLIDFDYVVTSMGNSFWKTLNNQYTFNGNTNHFSFLKNLFPEKFTNFNNFQKDTFNFLLFAKSRDICVSRRNDISCRRKKCISRNTNMNCGFIPNYPVVNLSDVAEENSPWKLLENIEMDFNNFLR